MNGSYIVNICDIARANSAYLEVLSSNRSQVALMHLERDEEIGSEVHDDLDQYIVIADGKGTSVLNGIATKVGMGDMVVVHAGTQHNIIANQGSHVGVFTIYSSPEHPADEFRPSKD